MPDNSEVLVRNWDELLTFEQNLDVGDRFRGPPHIFRGHADAEWKLQSTLHRAATNDGTRPLPSAAELLAIERHLTEQFRGTAAVHLSASVLMHTRVDADWWTLMRHYGVPTRILDWTSSFFVAAFFAVSSALKRDGAIYALHHHTLTRAMEKVFGPAANLGPTEYYEAILKPDAMPIVECFVRRNAMLDRMVAQQGFFMFCQNVAADVESVLSSELAKAADPEIVYWTRFPIPAALKPVVMRRLIAMNVTAQSLFPGLDGIGRHLDDITRNRAQQGLDAPAP